MSKKSKYKYKIEVHTRPNEKGEYFWMIASIDPTNPESQWCNSGAGWANSFEEAFVDAKKFFDKYKKERQYE